MNFYGLLNASKEQEIQTNGKNMKQIKNIKNKLEWEKYYDPNFDWDNIQFYKENVLSEDFIREFKDKVNWHLISCYQKLSVEFLISITDSDTNTIDWRFVLTNGWK